MVRVLTSTSALRGGLGLLAALMITTSAWAQDATGNDAGAAPDPAVSDVAAPDAGGDGQGIAVGEPSPYDETPPDVVIDDGAVIGGWEDDPAADGEGSGDDGWVDDVSDGGDDDWVDDGSDGGDNGWVDDGSDGGDDGWVDDGSDVGDDGWVDDGSDGGDGSVEPVDGSGDWGVIVDGEYVIRYLDGGPVTCDDCLPGVEFPMEEVYQMSAGGGAEGLPGAGPVRRSHAERSSFGVMSLSQCLTTYPEMPWICEWQFGADQ